jgi:regulator of protease activity HflC (stomatin/prohibitin superfamily)
MISNDAFNFNQNQFQDPNQNNMIPSHITIEKEYDASGGFRTIIQTVIFIIAGILLGALGILSLSTSTFTAAGAISLSLGIIIFFSSCCFCCGYIENEPNNAAVLTYFGKYVGTIKKTGFFWVNPFYSKTSISLKSKNLSSEIIKINDKAGNPIMMGCVVVWRVCDTARAIFDVQDYYRYVRIQTESALRFIGCLYPYDKIHEDDICLRSGHNEINAALKNELTDRLKYAGIEVIEARVTELSYAAEIANVMLKRQAAQAIISAREKIVQGAVSIIGHAVDSLKTNNICELNDEEKSDLVSNMLIVLCGESQVCPIVNTGH